MAITNATNFRKNVYKYLESAVDMNDVVYVTTKTGNAVILSEEDYRGLTETAYLNSIPGMAEHILAGRSENEETFTVDWKHEL